MLIDSDGKAPENIIIRVNGNNENSYGHAAIAVEEYDNDGNKTGNVIVYEVAGAPSGGDGEYKNSVVFGQGVTPDYDVEVIEKSAFLSQSQEDYDGVVEIETTEDQDQAAHSRWSAREIFDDASRARSGDGIGLPWSTVL